MDDVSTQSCAATKDTALRVYAYASDHRGWGSWSDLDQGIRSLEGDPMPVLREVFGTASLFTVDGVEGQIKRTLVSGLSDGIAESIFSKRFAGC